MKQIISLTLFIILTSTGIVSGNTSQNSTIDLTDTIRNHIRKEYTEISTTCTERPEIKYRFHLSVSPDQLILIASVPEYLCISANSFFSVVLSPDGTWRLSERIIGRPEIVTLGPGGRIWLSTQWMIEGTYPELLISDDGINWSDIPLPSRRNIDCCFEWLQAICFSSDQIRLHFLGTMSNKKGVWTSPLNIKNRFVPDWKRPDPEPVLIESQCLPVLPQGQWRKQSDKQSVTFSRPTGGSEIRFILPAIL